LNSFSLFLLSHKQQISSLNQGQFKIDALGVAVRRRDIPTLAKQHKKSQEQEQPVTAEKGQRKKAAGTKDKDTAAVEREFSDYRIVTSHFNTGTCARCHEAIEIGTRIAHPKNETSKGGWMHLSCLARSSGRSKVASRRGAKVKKEEAAAEEEQGDNKQQEELADIEPPPTPRRSKRKVKNEQK
jgi:hypothetical protein